MALDKTGLQAALASTFSDLANGKDADQAATEIANAIDTYVKTALATVSIPAGTVVIAAAPIAVPVLNPLPIPLTGGPATVPPGGLT